MTHTTFLRLFSYTDLAEAFEHDMCRQVENHPEAGSTAYWQWLIDLRTSQLLERDTWIPQTEINTEGCEPCPGDAGLSDEDLSGPCPW